MAAKEICPKCGKRTMKKVPVENNRFMWICEECGISRGPLKPDKKKGVV